MQDLVKLEEEGWQALSSAGDAAQKFYSSLLIDDAIAIFPGGLIVKGKEKFLESIDIRPWKFFKIEQPLVISITENVKAVIYKVTARRENNNTYTAIINSTYSNFDGDWKLVVHQQTPI